MQLPSLISQVLKKTAPMSAIDEDKIKTDCSLWYENMVKKATDAKAAGTETLVDKVVLHMDSWYVRLALAVLYFPIVAFIQNMMNPGDDHPDELPDDRR